MVPRTVTDASSADPPHATLRGHLQIMRADHWFKNVFVLPGVVVALGIDPVQATPDLLGRLGIGLASICLVASSNYVLNELVDAPSDRHHPSKKDRPVAAGRVHVPLAWAQWIVLMVAGVALGWMVSDLYAATMGALRVGVAT